MRGYHDAKKKNLRPQPPTETCSEMLLQLIISHDGEEKKTEVALNIGKRLPSAGRHRRHPSPESNLTPTRIDG